MQSLNMGVNQYIIVASHKTKVKKFNSIVIPLFSTILGVLRLSLGFRVLHGPKNNQSL
jgi:hypothetical protein